MKEKILRATAKILSQKGQKGVSTRAVCSAVGITAPTLYHYFVDKEDLLEAVTKSAFEKTRDRKMTQLEGDILGSLLQIWDNYVDFALSEPEYYSIVIAALSQGQVHPTGQVCFQQTIEHFNNAEKNGLLNRPAQEAALLYQAAAMGVAALSLLSESKDHYRKLSKDMKKMLQKGLFKDP
ncbi:MAG: TetR/AcrR family transcriptional regulator [Bdellovibrionales bacterium]